MAAWLRLRREDGAKRIDSENNAEAGSPPSLEQVKGKDALPRGGGCEAFLPNVLQIQIVVSYFLFENRRLSFTFLMEMLGNGRKYGIYHLL